MANEKSPESEEGPFGEKDFEFIDKVIPFDAEDEPSTDSSFEDIEEAEEESTLLMGPASSEIDIGSIVEEQEVEEKKRPTGFLHARKGNKREKNRHSHEGKKGRLNFGRFFLGIVLVFVGIVFLAQNMGWFSFVQVDLLSLWPLILIFLGLSMFDARRWWSKILGVISVFAVVLFVLGALIGGSQLVHVKLTGEVVEEERAVVNFSRISLQGVGSMVIEEGESESLVVKADEAVFSKIETSVSNGELTLKFKNPLFQILFWGGVVDIEYFITVKDIDSIIIDGSGSVISSGIRTDSLEVSINGSGEVDLNIEVEEFVARINGSGKYILSGTADRQIIHISGRGVYLGRDLISNETGIRISGSGEVEVYTEKELNVVISGSGRVRYSGEPFISNSSVSGSGSIKRFNTEISDVSEALEGFEN